jgi:hypothetical protein
MEHWPAMDFRKLYLLRVGWTNQGDYWCSAWIHYWTTLEDALEIQEEIEKMYQ